MNSHESAPGRAVALMAVRALAGCLALVDRSDLSARLVGASPTEFAAVAHLPAVRIPRRAGDDLPGLGFADRAIRFAAASGPHASALAPDHGHTCLNLVGSAAGPNAARTAALHGHLLACSTIQLAPPALVLFAANAPGGSASNLCRRHVALAYAGALRPCAALQRLALCPARLFSR